jgi:VanZ family protein
LTSLSPREDGPGPGGRARFSRYWLPVLGYIGLIFGLSSIHGNQIPSPFPYVDKVAHLLEYSFFGLLAGRAIRFTLRGRNAFITAFATILFGALIGMLDELYQRMIPGRESDPFDWLTDVTAVIIAVIVTQCIAVRPLGPGRKKRSEPAEG